MPRTFAFFCLFILLGNVGQGASNLISLDFRDTNLRIVFEALADKAGWNLFMDESVKGMGTFKVKNTPAQEFLAQVQNHYGLSCKVIGKTLYVKKKIPPPKIHFVQILKNSRVDAVQEMLSKVFPKHLQILTDSRKNSVLVNGRRTLVRLSKKILDVIENQPFSARGWLTVLHNGKELKVSEFVCRLGEETRLQETSSVCYPGGADQPPQVIHPGFSFSFTPTSFHEDGTFAGFLQCDLSWLTEWRGSFPILDGWGISCHLQGKSGTPQKVSEIFRGNLFSVYLTLDFNKAS